MNQALFEHLQSMLKAFADKIAEREPVGLRRKAALYACVRLAHQRAKEEPEKKFWKKYLQNLELDIERLKRTAEGRRELSKLGRDGAAFFEERRRRSS